MAARKQAQAELEAANKVTASLQQQQSTNNTHGSPMQQQPPQQQQQQQSNNYNPLTVLSSDSNSSTDQIHKTLSERLTPQQLQQLIESGLLLGPQPPKPPPPPKSAQHFLGRAFASKQQQEQPHSVQNVQGNASRVIPIASASPGAIIPQDSVRVEGSETGFLKSVFSSRVASPMKQYGASSQSSVQQSVVSGQKVDMTPKRSNSYQSQPQPVQRVQPMEVPRVPSSDGDLNPELLKDLSRYIGQLHQSSSIGTASVSISSSTKQAKVQQQQIPQNSQGRSVGMHMTSPQMAKQPVVAPSPRAQQQQQQQWNYGSGITSAHAKQQEQRQGVTSYSHHTIQQQPQQQQQKVQYMHGKQASIPQQQQQQQAYSAPATPQSNRIMPSSSNTSKAMPSYVHQSLKLAPSEVSALTSPTVFATKQTDKDQADDDSDSNDSLTKDMESVNQDTLNDLANIIDFMNKKKLTGTAAKAQQSQPAVLRTNTVAPPTTALAVDKTPIQTNSIAKTAPLSPVLNRNVLNPMTPQKLQSPPVGAGFPDIPSPIAPVSGGNINKSGEAGSDVFSDDLNSAAVNSEMLHNLSMLIDSMNNKSPVRTSSQIIAVNKSADISQTGIIEARQSNVSSNVSNQAEKEIIQAQQSNVSSKSEIGMIHAQESNTSTKSEIGEIEVQESYVSTTSEARTIHAQESNKSAISELGTVLSQDSIVSNKVEVGTIELQDSITSNKSESGTMQAQESSVSVKSEAGIILAQESNLSNTSETGSIPVQVSNMSEISTIELQKSNVSNQSNKETVQVQVSNVSMVKADFEEDLVKQISELNDIVDQNEDCTLKMEEFKKAFSGSDAS